MTASFTPETLALNEQADVNFSYGQPKVVQAFQRFGRVYTHPVCPEKCYVSRQAVTSAVIGETVTTTLFAMDKEGKDYQEALEDVNCILVSSGGCIQVVGTVTRQRANMYRVSYQPKEIGQNYLHIQVEGRHILGSPFSIMVQAPGTVKRAEQTAEKSITECTTGKNSKCLHVCIVNFRKPKSFIQIQLKTVKTAYVNYSAVCQATRSHKTTSWPSTRRSMGK